MSECIWIHYARPRPHWYGLDRYHIRGQQDFETVEIWRFLTAEAAFEHWAALTAVAYGELNAFANNIGLAIEGSP
jgi:hypothetical protein